MNRRNERINTETK